MSINCNHACCLNLTKTYVSFIAYNILDLNIKYMFQCVGVGGEMSRASVDLLLS